MTRAATTVVMGLLLVHAGCGTEGVDGPCEVLDHYPPPAGQVGSTAIEKDDPSIAGWATGFVEPVVYGLDVDEEWKTPDKALGPAAGGSSHIVALGAGGEIVLTFDPPIRDGDGPDLAVFENGVNDSFLELAFVEVSSDGVTFVRFHGVYLGNEPVDAFGATDTTLVGDLAGKYRQGQGTPFDLAALGQRTEVLEGALDLENVGFVKVVDILGDGSVSDCRGHPVYDPFPTSGSAGFDLDAVAVMNPLDSNEETQ